MTEMVVSPNQVNPVVDRRFYLLTRDSIRTAEMRILRKNKEYPRDLPQRGWAIALLGAVLEKTFS